MQRFPRTTLRIGDDSIRRLPPTGSLEAFLEAARSGSLRRASEQLNLSVSALSRRVQKLEHHVGRELFVRRGNEFSLNREGRALFSAIAGPFAQISDALDDCRPTGSVTLTIGVPTSFATAWLIPRLASFRAEHPEIELRLDTSGSPVEKLGESLDVIVVFAREGLEQVRFEPLRPQGAFTIAREGIVDPLMGLRANLRTTPLLVHAKLPQILESWRAEMRLADDFPLTIEEYDDGPLLVAAAQSGLGVALVLEDMMNFYGNAPGLVRPFGEHVCTPFSYAIATRRAEAPAHAIERFRDWIRRETARDFSLRATKEKAEAA